MITVWQDSPEYGCDDHPSFKWFARHDVDGHIVEVMGPFDTYDEADQTTQQEPRS